MKSHLFALLLTVCFVPSMLLTPAHAQEGPAGPDYDLCETCILANHCQPSWCPECAAYCNGTARQSVPTELRLERIDMRSAPVFLLPAVQVTVIDHSSLAARPVPAFRL